ncbi:glycosyltransferase family 25 protein [Tianweitania sediminis]|uniref:Glycosyltransferase family 25 protein n=1 Tax=Tianweitania sediminis TaxID=1502156 RepID=A0A8J7R7N1_9HYPH|nr:glycosyltransferase family 25 protein [Tianweitania sediminis]
MEVFFINLDRSPERRAFMMDQLEALGVSFERIAAVDGKTADLTRHAGSPLTQTEIACFLSHRDCWKRIVDLDLDYGLILEDDVRLSPRFAAVASDTAWLNPLNGLAKLDTSGRKVLLERQSKEGPAGLRFHRLRSEHTGCAGYIISRGKAREFLGRSSARLTEPVDLFVFGEQAVAEERVVAWQAVPAVVAQEKRFASVAGKPMDSVIGSRRGKRGSLATLAKREICRALRKMNRAVQRLPSRLASRRILIRVPFG